jgi:hypothetical protein
LWVVTWDAACMGLFTDLLRRFQSHVRQARTPPLKPSDTTPQRLLQRCEAEQVKPLPDARGA